MRLTHDHYVERLRADAALLSAAAARGLDAAVPTCPGWSVGDLVEHVAEVYRHKVACIREQDFPDPWPRDRGDQPTLPYLDDGLDQLVTELTTHDPLRFAATWWWDERTVGFWGRRMAHETAIHRVDAELAHGVSAPVDEALALDGIDEVLRRFLAGDWSDEPVSGRPGTTVRVRSADEAWRIVMEPSAIVAHVDRWPDEPVQAVLTGDPVPLYLWLWGRGPDDSLVVEGEQAAIDHLGRRMRPATQ